MSITILDFLRNMLYLSYTAVIPHKMTKGTDDMNENVKAALKKERKR